MTTIYCFIGGRWSNGDVSVIAWTEEHLDIAGHVSSGVGWAKHDIGINSDWYHDKYRELYPDGYELKWVDDIKSDAELRAAFARARDPLGGYRVDSSGT